MPSQKQTDDRPERVSIVYCERCKVWFPVYRVVFANIEEDFMGRDVMHFHCPECGTQQMSNIILRYE